MKSKFFYLVAVNGFLSLSFALGSSAQPEKAEAGIRAIMQQQAVAGLSVAVVKKGKIIYAHSFGMRDMENRLPLTNENLFRIASISKSFSATAVMQLVEKKKLSLDDDVSTLIGFKVRNPKFPETVITLRNLMSHRSSLNDSQGYFTLDVINPDKNPDWAKCFSEYEPGKDYRYCNLNYNMVGTIIERVSGERFDQYIKHHILDPLELYGGYCVDSLDKTRFANIYEYLVDSSKFRPSPDAYAPRSEEIAKYVMGYSAPIFSPTGGMKISATDLAKYMTMHMQMGKHKGKRIISKKSAKEMQEPLPGKENYGLAIATSTKLIPGETMKGHTGSAYGLYSIMYFQPKEKFGIVVISNGCDPRYTEGYNTVMQQAVQSLYESLIRDQLKN
jgi:CubicO group peptidase (beta-lactamase class C family)